MGKTETISPKVRNKTWVLTLSTPIQHSLGMEFLARAIRQEKEIKEIQTDKKEVKLSLLTDGMILYLKVLKNSTKKHLHTINSFSKVAGYKINL
jgi:hypothetical protein